MAGAGAAGGRSDPFKTIAQVQKENLGSSEKDDFFSTKATILHIKSGNFSYPACLKESCNKKVIDVEDGTWRCEKCDQSYPKPEYRYIMSLDVNDHTGHLLLTCFDEVGRMIIGRSADQMMELKEESDDDLKQAFEDATCKTMVFKIRARTDNYQDQQR
jgi:replication factor A1